VEILGHQGLWAALPAKTPGNVFHPVLELELSLLDRDFFDLFGFRKVGFESEFRQTVFEFLMSSGESAELIVSLEQS
jgi:hypothetical protein